jgi:cytochrome c-type biogenesis protein
MKVNRARSSSPGFTNIGDMNTPQHTSLMAAFAAGLLSFISPCVLPLVPSYLSYVTGLSFDQLTDQTERQRFRKTILINSLLFIAGFSAVFIAFGASASLIGGWLSDYQSAIRKIGGFLIIVFGLYLTGVLRLTFLMREKRFHWTHRPAGYSGSLLIGAAFAAGWTPCVGPVLGAMLTFASTSETLWDGVTLLAFYSFGLGLPLFIAALGLDRFLGYIKGVRRYLGIISVVNGTLLVVFGLLLYTNSLGLLTAFFEQHGIGWYFGLDGNS